MQAATPAHTNNAGELRAMATERLEAELCEWAAMIAAADCRFLEMVAEFDRRRAWASWGMASAAHWLSWKCALSPSAARERVRVARIVVTLPHTLARFRTGRLSYSKVRTITRVATADTELDLLELAENATAAQLGFIVRGWRKCLESDNERAVRQHERRSVTYRHDDDGSLVGRFSLPAEEAPAFIAAIEAFQAPSWTSEQRAASAEAPPSVAQRRADALVDMADAALGGRVNPARARPLTVVEVEQPVLSHDGPGTCQTSHGVAIAPETARRMACRSAEVRCVRNEYGEEVRRSRATPTIPARVRRDLHRRDRDRGRCRFPGCGRQGTVEAHHLVHRAHGGDHRLENLVTLCRHHHHLVHEGGYQLSLGPDQRFEAVSPHGHRISERPHEPAAAGPFDLQHSYGRGGTRFTPSTLAAGTGERMRVDDVMFVVADRVESARRRATRASAEAHDAPPDAAAGQGLRDQSPSPMSTL